MSVERRFGNNGQKEIERVEIRIPVEELSHDISVDKEHVQILVKSIEQSGQLSSILVWTHDNQIIDGFHRLEALKAVGTDTAICNLIDCSEEEFRDARIISAVIHKGVSFPRIVKWASEAFGKTPWGEKMKASEAFHLEHKAKFSKAYKKYLRRKALSYNETQELVSWVKQKSSIWGLKTEVIARMLDLADIASPLLIPLVAQRHHPREEVLTRSTLRSIVEGIPDHKIQEALALKAMAERLNEEEVRSLVKAFSFAKTDEEVQKVLSTSWLNVKPSCVHGPERPVDVEKIYIIRSEEEKKRFEEDTKKANERFKTASIIEDLVNIAGTLPDLKIENNPDLKPKLDEAIDMLLMSIKTYRGEDYNILKGLEEKIDKITQENQSLKASNRDLTKELESLRRVLGIGQKLAEDESRLRKD